MKETMAEVCAGEVTAAADALEIINDPPHAPVDVSPRVELTLQLEKEVVDVPVRVPRVTVGQVTLSVHCHSVNRGQTTVRLPGVTHANVVP